MLCEAKISSSYDWNSSAGEFGMNKNCQIGIEHKQLCVTHIVCAEWRLCKAYFFIFLFEFRFCVLIFETSTLKNILKEIDSGAIRMHKNSVEIGLKIHSDCV